MKIAEPSILVFFNPAAQSGRSILIYQHYVAFLEQNDIAFETYKTKGDGLETDAKILVKLHQFSLVSVIGGDGTLNIAVNSLAELGLTFLLIPAGSGNDLAKMLYPNGIPSLLNIFEMTLRAGGASVPIDYWRCNDRLFINGFGVGFDGSIAYKAKYKKGRLSPKLKYWVEILKHIFFYRSSIIYIDGKPTTTFMLSVANGKVYGGDFMVAPNANVADGQLDLVHIGALSVIQRLLNLPLMKKGKHLHRDFVYSTRGETVEITSENKLRAHIDGEPLLEHSYAITFEGQIDFRV